jgi:hypothetical protein
VSNTPSCRSLALHQRDHLAAAGLGLQGFGAAVRVHGGPLCCALLAKRGRVPHLTALSEDQARIAEHRARAGRRGCVRCRASINLLKEA